MNVEFDECPDEEYSAQRPIRLERWWVRRWDVESGDYMKTWRGLPGDAPARGLEVPRGRCEEVIVRVARQSAVADILLDDVADRPDSLVGDHGASPFSR